MTSSNATTQTFTSICTLFRPGEEDDISSDLYSGFSIFLAISNIAIALLTLAGNGVTFVAFYKTRSLRTPSNLLLLCLSISDFLAGSVAEPVHAAEIIFAMKDPAMACRVKDFYSIAMFVTTVASVVSISFVSTERYLAVFYPHKHNVWITKSRVFKLIILFWVVWIIVTGFTHTEHGLGTWGYSCFGTIGVCVPVILFVNFKLLKEARKHTIAINSCSVGDEERRRQRESKSIKMVAWVVGLFLLCNLPILGTFMGRKFGRWKGKMSALIWMQANTLSLSSSCVDPFLYFWKKRDVRDAIAKLFSEAENKQQI